MTRNHQVSHDATRPTLRPSSPKDQFAPSASEENTQGVGAHSQYPPKVASATLGSHIADIAVRLKQMLFLWLLRRRRDVIVVSGE
jgi:hypothetical protein